MKVLQSLDAWSEGLTNDFFLWSIDIFYGKWKDVSLAFFGSWWWQQQQTFNDGKKCNFVEERKYPNSNMSIDVNNYEKSLDFC